MADPVENGDIFVEDEIKVDVEATSVNLNCVKTEPNEGTLDFEEDNHSTQYKITLKYEDIYAESSRQIKIEEDYNNLIGFLDNDVIMENAMIKLETIKEEDDGSFNNFYCRNCKGIYKSYCLKCSTLLCILNNNTSIASFEAESNTIPTDILEIRATSRGKGVYLLRTLPINIIFGPFEGILGIESTIGHIWKIINNKLRNIKSGNWMKNIDCAASASLNNLDIFQIDGNLYFQTNREITEGEELLIYYDNEKLQQLDNSKECFYTPQKQEQLPKIFACTLCCLGFGSNICLMEHKRKCCQMEHSRNMDEFVLIECNYCKMCMEKWEHEEHHVAYCLEKHHRTWSAYSEAVDRSDANVELMGEGNCGTRAGKRRYLPEICSRRKDRRNKLQFNTKEYQCLSGGNDDETRCLNECGGGLVERSKYLKLHIRNKHIDDGDEKDYKYSECSFYQTHNQANLRRHLNKHKGIKPFQCDICMMTFTRKDYLNTHAADATDKDYQCTECSFETNYKRHYQAHLNKHRGIRPFQCEICMMKFTLKGSLKLHIRNKHTDDSTGKDYKCSHCSFQTNYKFSFQTHIDMHKGIKPFQCEICMNKFTEKGNLKKHIKNAHADDATDKDHQCPECSYQTNYKRHYQAHLNKHRGIRPFQCEICMKTFTRKDCLKTHIKNTHADDATDKDYQCPECSYQTNYKRYYQAHLNKHRGIRPFQCDICMKTYTREDILTAHIKNTHVADATDKDYQCSECSYQTNYKGDFQRHLNMHRGIKPFQCEICMMAFTQKGNLTAHIKNTHVADETDKDYQCSECSYETNHKANFQKHLNKHRGIKPFQCEICMKTFTLKGNLKSHAKNKHTD